MKQHSARPAIEAALRNPNLMTAAVALSENRLEDAEPLLRGHLREAPTDVAAIRMMAELAARVVVGKTAAGSEGLAGLVDQLGKKWTAHEDKAWLRVTGCNWRSATVCSRRGSTGALK